MIVKDGESYFLDWELALWGDPVYDLAVHFHKMGYTSAERNHVLQLWQAALSRECIEGWEYDLDTYLAHEQIKSAIVDTVRCSQAFIDPSYAPEPEHVLVDKLTVKLNNAYRRAGRSPNGWTSTPSKLGFGTGRNAYPLSSQRRSLVARWVAGRQRSRSSPRG